MRLTLYYAHDPMCSWCYAFGPVWQRVQAGLPETVEIRRLLGGLAGDTAEPMPDDMRRRIEATWQRIEESVPGTAFNFDFWQRCTPRRATYAACRAVIAARQQGATRQQRVEFDVAMTGAIQRAYYRQARNPSERDTLIGLAGELGLDVAAFTAYLGSTDCERTLQEEIALCHTLHADSFPALVLEVDGSTWPVAIDYLNPEAILDTIDFLING